MSYNIKVIPFIDVQMMCSIIAAFLKISSIRNTIFSYGSSIIELQSTKAISELDKCIDVTELINNEATKQNFIYGGVKYKAFKVLK